MDPFYENVKWISLSQVKQKNNLFLEGEKQKVCFHLEKKVSKSKLRD
jgi:hypothetical protein